MSSLVERLHNNKLITPPNYVLAGMQYETIMGSIAYGVADTTNKERPSDIDVYGFCIPYKDMVFPHLKGRVQGFGRQVQRFDQYQNHGIKDESNKKEYDITIYNIIKYFQLCMENNPNMIDSLFTPQRCVLYCSQVGNLVRENRKIFLHKGGWFKFKGYAYSQLHKLKTKKIRELINLQEDYNIPFNITYEDVDNRVNNNCFIEGLKDVSENVLQKLFKLMKEGGKDKLSSRRGIVKKYGYDIKFGYHIVRLLNEIEQIMIEGDLSLDRNREQLKSIRRGEWTIEQLEEYFNNKEKELEEIYLSSKLQHSPDEKKIKQLLINCLEIHFGDLKNVINKPKSVDDLVNDIQQVIDKYRVVK